MNKKVFINSAATASSAQSTHNYMQYDRYHCGQGHGWAAEDANAIWTLTAALKVSANKKDLAREMLTMLLDSLPEFRENLSRREDIPSLELAKIIHKFAGSAVYSGMPGIKKLCNTIESILRETQSQEECEPELLELEDNLDRIEKESPAWLKLLES